MYVTILLQISQSTTQQSNNVFSQRSLLSEVRRTSLVIIRLYYLNYRWCTLRYWSGSPNNPPRNNQTMGSYFSFFPPFFLPSFFPFFSFFFFFPFFFFSLFFISIWTKNIGRTLYGRGKKTGSFLQDLMVGVVAKSSPRRPPIPILPFHAKQ